jgi:hypothetical protein
MIFDAVIYDILFGNSRSYSAAHAQQLSASIVEPVTVVDYPSSSSVHGS